MDPLSRRVVVTGIGLAAPCGIGVDASWETLIAGRSCIGPITLFDPQRHAVRIAGEVKGWDPLRFVEKKKVRQFDRFMQLAFGAACLAVQDAGLELTDQERAAAACIVGAGLGGLDSLERNLLVAHDPAKGPSRVSPYMIPNTIPNMAAAQISMAWGLRGPSLCISTACASGADAIGLACDLIRAGRCPAALAGGTEAIITPGGIASFQAMLALSRRNHEPQRASRPFDRDRDGFVCAEGAGILVLEPMRRAAARGARIYAEVTGYGASSDAFHPVHPCPEGAGARLAMERALADARLHPKDIDYVNAHGTSTPAGDVHECTAIRSVFGDHAASRKLWVSSTKSMTGHLLGGAGALEAAVCALACAHAIVPPTINVDAQDPACDLDVVPNEARRRTVRHALSNSFGLGGCNATLILSRV